MFAARQRRVPQWPLPPNTVVVREYVQGVLVAETLRDKAAPLPVREGKTRGRGWRRRRRGMGKERKGGEGAGG